MKASSLLASLLVLIEVHTPQDAVFVLVLSPCLSQGTPDQGALHPLTCFSSAILVFSSPFEICAVLFFPGLFKNSTLLVGLLPAGLMKALRYPPRALLSHRNTLCLENVERLMNPRAVASRHGETDPFILILGGNNSVSPSPSGRCSPPHTPLLWRFCGSSSNQMT